MDFQRSEGAQRFDLSFYITDHSADNAVTGMPERLLPLYRAIKSNGIESIRYDWHWRIIEPAQGKYDVVALTRYAYAARAMVQAGLQDPTIILSNPPDWAKKLYKEDKESFFKAYEQYVREVELALILAGCPQIACVQVLNELNVTGYNPVDVHDIPTLCRITRNMFSLSHPDIQIMVTVLASNSLRLPFVGTPIEEYLPRLKRIRNNFDVIAVDYYPGMWHFPLKHFARFWPSAIYKAFVSDVDLLRSTFEEIATWGNEYELGEVGMHTNFLLADGERAQRYFYDAFFRAFKHLMVELRAKGLRLPSRIGFYEAIDEPPKDLKGKLLRGLLPFPEYDMGMRRSNYRGKLILWGNLHLPVRLRVQQPSQLQKIMRYLRSSV